MGSRMKIPGKSTISWTCRALPSPIPRRGKGQAHLADTLGLGDGLGFFRSLFHFCRLGSCLALMFEPNARGGIRSIHFCRHQQKRNRKIVVVGKSVLVSVDDGGGRIIKKKK